MDPIQAILPDDAIRLAFFQCGQGGFAPDGWVHEKTVPYAIIAQAVAGHYEITCGGRTIEAAAPEAFLTPANQPMRIIHHADGAPGCRARWIHFSFTLFETIDVSSLLEMPLKIEATPGRELGRIMEELLCPPAASQATFPLLETARRRELLWQTLRIVCQISRPRPEAVQRVLASQRLEPALAYLRQHLARPVNVTQMARLVSMSESRFFAYFRQHMGASPMAYLKRLRLNEAAYTLSSTDLPLKQIADRVGFANPFHLSREFKQQFSLSPVQYRALAMHGLRPDEHTGRAS